MLRTYPDVPEMCAVRRTAISTGRIPAQIQGKNVCHFLMRIDRWGMLGLVGYRKPRVEGYITWTMRSGASPKSECLAVPRRSAKVAWPLECYMLVA